MLQVDAMQSNAEALKGSPQPIDLQSEHSQPKRLGHVAVRVEEIERAVAFYQGLGMALVWKDADWAYLKAGEDGLALLGPGYQHAGPHFGFVFRDRGAVETAYAQLSEAGVKVTPIHDHRDGTASFYGRDPDGNWFEYLYEPYEPDAARLN